MHLFPIRVQCRHQITAFIDDFSVEVPDLLAWKSASAFEKSEHRATRFEDSRPILMLFAMLAGRAQSILATEFQICSQRCLRPLYVNVGHVSPGVTHHNG